jgi:hypothetical protein
MEYGMNEGSYECECKIDTTFRWIHKGCCVGTNTELFRKLICIFVAS